MTNSSGITIFKRSPSLKDKANFGAVIRQIERHIKNGGKAAFFDCDRVLVDPDRANATSIMTILKEYGLKPRPCGAKEFVDICSGTGPRKVLLNLAPDLMGRPEMVEEMVLRLAEIAALNTYLIEKTLIVDYLPEIRVRNVKTGIMTNRYRIAIHPIIKRFEIGVDVLLHQSRRIPAKPELDMFAWGVRLADVPKELAMLWDDNLDCVKGARQFGMPSRLVKWNADAASASFEYLQG